MQVRTTTLVDIEEASHTCGTREEATRAECVAMWHMGQAMREQSQREKNDAGKVRRAHGLCQMSVWTPLTVSVLGLTPHVQSRSLFVVLVTSGVLRTVLLCLRCCGECIR